MRNEHDVKLPPLTHTFCAQCGRIVPSKESMEDGKLCVFCATGEDPRDHDQSIRKEQ